ncbi:MAG: hypothetical protein Fur0043_28380 [Anaerolineales bacterium]
MMKRLSYIRAEKWLEDLPSYLAKVAHQYLPLEQFGFYETYREMSRPDAGRVIFNSESCRIYLSSSWEGNPYSYDDGYYTLMILYGRLHAPDNALEMEWNGEVGECWLYPWHRYYDFLYEAFPKKGRPLNREIYDEFKKLEQKFPDFIHWRIALEAEKWKHYTPELFYLFDLRRPGLWEQYRAWLRARYIVEGRNEEDDKRKGLIPYYRVC